MVVSRLGVGGRLGKEFPRPLLFSAGLVLRLKAESERRSVSLIMGHAD